MPGASFPTVLGLETSCDETAAAIVNGDGVVCSVLASQHDLHRRYGGVVPELAARRHIETMEGVVADAMRQAKVEDWVGIDAIAVTKGPGLAGALLVGVSFGKALAYARSLPLVAVNHLEGHLASAWIERPDFPTPCVVLIVSGGHTHLYYVSAPGIYRLIGRTLDDAAGEAFDKAAKMLQLEYPGGPAVDRVARQGNPQAIRFPRPMLQSNRFDFSFSGLKTALLYYVRKLDHAGQPRPVADIAAGFQEAIVDVVVIKAMAAVKRCGVKALAVVGGVSANTRLRERLAACTAADGIHLALPSIRYCTDNAAMIAAAGRQAYLQGRFASWDLEADPDSSLTEAEPRRQRAVPERSALNKPNRRR